MLNRPLEWLSQNPVIWGNSLQQYLIALGIFVALTLIFYIVMKVIRVISDRLASKTHNEILKLLLEADNRLMPVVMYIPVYVMLHYLTVSEKVYSVVAGIWVILVTLSVVRYLLDILTLLIAHHQRKHGHAAGVAQAMHLIISVVLYSFGAIFVLSNLGFNINTLIAGLGIGGMAVALASQTLLGDLFNYFTILVDQPFKVGDTIVISGINGTVTKIGLKGTRITSTDGDQVIVSNTDMTKSILRNYTPDVMHRRRVLARLGVTYHASYEQMKQVPERLRVIISAVENVAFVRAHFVEFGDSSMNFELAYYVNSADYGLYMDKQQEINFLIMAEFEKIGVEFAFPSQSIYVEKMPNRE